jgi:hypothetical protein
VREVYDGLTGERLNHPLDSLLEMATFGRGLLRSRLWTRPVRLVVPEGQGQRWSAEGREPEDDHDNPLVLYIERAAVLDQDRCRRRAHVRSAVADAMGFD